MTSASCLKAAIRRGHSDDARLQALIDFTLKAMETKGFVSNEDLAALRAAGYADANIADVMVVITQKTLSNYFNHVHDTVRGLPVALSMRIKFYGVLSISAPRLWKPTVALM